MLCCGGDNKLPSTYVTHRSCTDVFFLVLFVVFWVGFLVLGGLSLKSGDPNRLLYGTDYLGYVCGKGTGPPEFSNHIPDQSVYQSQRWEENTHLWVPLAPEKALASSNDTNTVLAMAYQGVQRALCVRQCPEPFHNAQSPFSALFLPESQKVYTYGDVPRHSRDPHSNHSALPWYIPAYYPITYDTQTFAHRCVPQRLPTDTLSPYLSQIPYAMQISGVLTQGLSELCDCWRVLLLSAALCVLLSVLYIQLMRLAVKPLVWLSIVLVLLLFLLLTWYLHTQAEAMANPARTPQASISLFSTQSAQFWRLSSYGLAATTLVYVLLMFWFARHVDTACDMIRMGGRVLSAAPSMVGVSLVTSAVQLLIVVWSAGVGLFLYTSDCSHTVQIPFSIRNSTFSWGNQTMEESYNIGGFVCDDLYRPYLYVYTLFGALWSLGFVTAVGFTILAFCTVFWYFSCPSVMASSPEKREAQASTHKYLPYGSIARATCWTLGYHAGTLALGTLLIALVQMLRIAMRLIATQAEKVAGRPNVNRFFSCIAECLLACFEKFLKVISRNGYIVMCITSQCFCSAAREAFHIILDNIATAVVLSAVEGVVIGLGKMLVVFSCVLCSHLLLQRGIFCEESFVSEQSTVLPLVFIAVVCYFMSCVFFQVYAVCIDTIYVCYYYDLKHSGGKYAPVEMTGFVQDKPVQEETAR